MHVKRLSHSPLTNLAIVLADKGAIIKTCAHFLFFFYKCFENK